MLLSTLVEEMKRRQFMAANPVLEASRKGRIDVAVRAMGEYSALIMNIVPLLRRIASRAEREGWAGIHSELLRNIAEEDGSRTNGVPHRVIISGHFGDLGLPWPADLAVCHACTQGFIRALHTATDGVDASFAVGAALALEMTASPELQFVARTLNEILVSCGRDPIPDAVITGGRRELHRFDKFSLNGFFAHHIHVWEEGHRAGLEFAVIHTDGIDQDHLAQGFCHVLDLMDAWWSQLAQDS